MPFGENLTETGIPKMLSLIRTENPFPAECKHYGRQCFIEEITTNTTFCALLMILIIYLG